ncbi:MAG: FixH family protein, partial [Pseudomonas sp.]
FAVVIGMGLLYVSLLNPDSMVRDNYYKEGRAINMHLGRDHLARELELQAQFSIDELTGDVALQLDGKLEQLPSSLLLEIMSPTHAERDRSVQLRQISANHYAGQMPSSIQGRHYIDLSDPTRPGEDGWRLTGEVTLVMGQQHQLSAH